MSAEALIVYVAKRRNTAHGYDWLDPNTVAPAPLGAKAKAERINRRNLNWAEKHPVIEVVKCVLKPDSPVQNVL